MLLNFSNFAWGKDVLCPPGKVATALVVIGSGIVSGGVERVTPLRGRALGDYRISPDGPASLAGGPQHISLVHLLFLRCYRYFFAGALTPQVGHEFAERLLQGSCH